jgi:hypothetical protein
MLLKSTFFIPVTDKNAHGEENCFIAKNHFGVIVNAVLICT